MPLTSALPEALRQLLPASLQAVAVAVSMRKGERLFAQQQSPGHMYFVVNGEVVLERSGARGDTLVLQRVRHGFVAEASLQSARYHCDALVTASGQAVALPIAPLKEELARDPAFALRWIDMLNGEVRRLRAQCERMSLKGVRERLLHLLETEGRHGRLSIQSGLKSLATELAVSHEALYRTVAVLEKEGLIGREAGSIALLRQG